VLVVLLLRLLLFLGPALSLVPHPSLEQEDMSPVMRNQDHMKVQQALPLLVLHYMDFLLLGFLPG
jgi:hypothetical protein